MAIEIRPASPIVLTPPDVRSPARGLHRISRGLLSMLGTLAWPIGPAFRRRLAKLHTPERHERGLALILPGVDGESFLNHSIAWGLFDGGFSGAIDIHDWTTGNPLRFLTHLRNEERHGQAARRIADRILEYRHRHPGRPVHMVGHSAGGAMALLALERLPAATSIDSAILLAPAISEQYNLAPILARVERGIWNFSSWFDWIFLRAGTTLLGTVDGLHRRSAGAGGFVLPVNASAADRELYHTRLHERPFESHMLAGFHFAGHFGSTNRVFVAENIAPLLAAAPIEALPVDRCLLWPA